jgi:redox-sensitive bicupin YhaK (pirin superfamily)
MAITLPVVFRGQATMTYMLQGSSQHEDSTGNLGTLEAGDVQWMVAGRGGKCAQMFPFGFN